MGSASEPNGRGPADPWDVGPIQGVARRWLSGKQDDCSGETRENDLAQFLHGLFNGISRFAAPVAVMWKPR